MGRLAHLMQTIKGAASQPNINYILVDYSCPEKSGEWAIREYPHIQVVNVPDKKYFDLALARNTGGYSAKTEWLCFLDADGIVHSDFSSIISSHVKPGYYFRHPRINMPGYNGFVVCRAEDFRRVGGYDERCQDYGWEDSEFYERLTEFGIKETTLPDEIIVAIDHDYDLRAKYCRERETYKTWLRNKNFPKRSVPGL